MTDWQHFLQQQGALFREENGVSSAVTFGEGPEQYPQLLDQNLLFDLGQLSLLRCNGDGARKMLQGQTTCDFNLLTDKQGLLGAQCTPKGRMIATFFAIEQSGEVSLVLPDTQVSAVKESLAKYAPFFRVTLESDSSHQLIGLSGPDADSICRSLLGEVPDTLLGVYQNDQGLAVKLSEQRLLLIIPRQQAQQIWQALQVNATAAGTPLWTLQEIQDGFSHVTPAIREQMVPQMLNLQALGGINFKKGCYTGQEVVARLHYLGKSKRHMYRIAVNVPAGVQPPPPGTACYLPDSEQHVGDVVSAALSTQQTMELLAVFKESGLHAETLQIGDQPPAPVTWLPLPYSVETP